MYSDGYILGVTWSWPESDVLVGDTVGLCVGQNETDPLNYLSCWSLLKQDDGSYADNKSYLVDPLTVAFDDTSVFEMEALDAP